MKTYRFKIEGKVQGVFYRKRIQENASKAGFSGYVKNLSDGSVEAVVQCDEERLQEFSDLLQTGSLASRVDHIVFEEVEAFGEKGFAIRY